jgi:WD40 repeat protein
MLPFALAAVLSSNLLHPPGLVTVIGTPAFRLKDPDYLLHISPDGRRLYTGYLASGDNRVGVSVRDGETGLVVNSYVPIARDESILHSEFAPDGLRLLIQTADIRLGALYDKTANCRVRVVDPDTGRVLREGRPWVPAGGRDAWTALGLRFHLASSWLLINEGETTRFVETETGKVRSFDPPLPAEVRDASLSPDGRFLAVQLKDESVRVHDIPSGKQRVGFPATPDKSRRLVGYTPDSRGVAVWVSGGKGCTLEVRDPDGKLLRTLVENHRTSARVVFDPTGKTFACEDGRWPVEIRDAVTGRLVREVPGDVRHVAYSPDGKTLWTVRGTAYATTLVSFDVTTGRMRAASAYPPGLAHPYQFRADGQLVGLVTGHVFAWDPRTGRESARVPIAPPFDWPYGVGFDAAGDRLLTAPVQQEDAKVWDYRTGTVTPAPAGPKSPDGKGAMWNAWLQAEWEHRGWTFRVLPGDTADGRPKPGEWTFPDSFALSLPYLAPDNKRLVAAKSDRQDWRGKVAVLDITDPKSKPVVLTLEHDIRWNLKPAFSPDGRWAAVAGVETRVTKAGEEDIPLVSVFDLTVPRRAVKLELPVPSPSECSFSPDGRLLAVAGKVGVLALVETTTWKVRALVHPPPGSSNSRGWAEVRWSPDGKLFATTTPDGRIAVWDLARVLAASPK